MLGTSNLGKSYGARTLFEGVSLKLNSGARYGLVGANGSGKTTFLNILSAHDTPTEGHVSLPKECRLGVLRQDRFLDDDTQVIDLAMMGDRTVWNALREQQAILEGDGDPTRLVAIEDVLRAFDGYTLEARATWVLDGLGIPSAKHREALGTLSGGFKLRVLLAQVLLGGPDVLLLDEPTNHLDILSIRWLEKFLAAYKGCAVVISHDQRFLDNVATHVLDVDYGTITIYPGNYAAFVTQKSSIRAQKEAEIAQKEAEIAHKQAYVDRFRYSATKARQAQSRLKQIEKIEVDELADTTRRSPRFLFEPERPSGREVLTIDGVSKAYGDNRVLRNVSLTVRRGEKLAIIGPNGLGKSTLLKIAVGAVAADAGAHSWGHEARLGYFAQDHREILTDPDETPIDFLWKACPKEGTAFVRGQLGRVLFSGADVDKRIGSLSGGEAARLVFGRLMAEKPNVLVLDEPTNHLDLESIDALVRALAAFEGTVIFVSHDRWFVSELATRILEVRPEGPRDFPGTYSDYLAQCGDDHLDAEAVVLKEKKLKREVPVAAEVAGPSGLSWEEQKRRRNRQKDLPARRDKVLADIEAAEGRKSAIQARYCTPGFYEATSKAEIAKLEAEEASLGPKIDALMTEWEALEAELGGLG